MKLHCNSYKTLGDRIKMTLDPNKSISAIMLCRHHRIYLYRRRVWIVILEHRTISEHDFSNIFKLNRSLKMMWRQMNYAQGGNLQDG